MLRPYQQAAVQRLHNQLWRSHSAALLVAPTGSGKTKLAVWGVIRKAVLEGKTVLFVVQLRQVVRQTAAELAAEGIPHAIFMAGHKRQDAPVQVASVQTIAARSTEPLPKFDIVVIDECQHSVANQYRQLLARVRAANPRFKLLGLTATPIRGDGKGLGVSEGGIFETLDVVVQPPELVKGGYLVPVVIFGVDPDDLDKLRVDPKTRDYDERELSELMRRTRYVGAAVEIYRERANGLRCIVFCVDVAHVNAVVAEYRAAGYSVESTTAETPDGERVAILERFRRGQTKILVNCDVYTEGFDQPLIGAVQMLRPTRSLSRWLQAAGRGLRPITPDVVAKCHADGIPVPYKKHVILLDHGGNVQRHGSPLDAREWTLDGHDTSKAAQEARDAAAAARVGKCEECGATVLRGQAVCPNCGAPLAKNQATAEAIAGKLVHLITGADRLAPGQEPRIIVVD